MSPMSMAKPSSGGVDLDRHLADADFAGERMRAAVAALGGIAEAEQKALVAARQRLQPHVARRRGSVSGSRVRSPGSASAVAVALDQPFVAEDVGHARHRRCVGRRFRRRAPARRRRRQGEVQQPVRVVEGRAQHLAARQVLEGRRDAARACASRRCRSAAVARSAAAWCDRRAAGRPPRSGRPAPA